MQNTEGRRERKKIQVKKTISDTAMKMFFEKGFAETTVAEIMEEADLGTGTFYNYFYSKEDILKYCLAEKIDKARHTLESLQQSSLGASQKLWEVLFEAGRTYEENRDLIGLYMKFHRDRHHTGSNSPHGQIFKDILTGIIREGQEKGEFRVDVPHGIIIEMFSGILKSTMGSGLEIPLMDNLRHKLNLLLEGLRGTLLKC